MSIKTNIDSILYSIREQISKDLQIKIEGSKYIQNSKPKYIYPYEVIDEDIYLPFAYGMNLLNTDKRPPRLESESRNIVFSGSLREQQKEVKKEALKYLNKTGSVLLSMACGFGKTCTSLYIASKIKMKTLIIMNRLVLMDQWKESIDIFCKGSTVQVLTPKSKMKDCDFYIMNAINVSKMGHHFFKDIRTVIIDEAHLIMSDVLSRSLQYVTPRYIIGLTATPYRPDGMDVLMDLYFGKKKIVRKLFRKHLVYKIDTGFKPKVEMASNGKINWGVVLDSQANDIPRNEFIIDIVKKFDSRNFLILCKRVAQAHYLVKRLNEENEDVTSLIGSQRVYNQTSRILVGTTGKCSVGFDHPRLDTLLLAGDVEQYYIQVLGRVFRTQEGEPIIFDLVDNNSVLKRHFSTRKHVYLEHGGIIKNVKKEFIE